jgi:hypothetical protein
LAAVTTKASAHAANSEAAKRSGISTPWGPSTLVEEARVAQSVGEKKFEVLLQLLESSGGQTLLRIAYTSDGIARRGPVTVRARDVKRLRAALERRPALAAALGLGAGDS